MFNFNNVQYDPCDWACGSPKLCRTDPNVISQDRGAEPISLGASIGPEVARMRCAAREQDRGTHWY